MKIRATVPVKPVLSQQAMRLRTGLRAGDASVGFLPDPNEHKRVGYIAP